MVVVGFGKLVGKLGARRVAGPVLGRGETGADEQVALAGAGVPEEHDGFVVGHERGVAQQRDRRRSWRMSRSTRSASARNVGCEIRRWAASSQRSPRVGARPVSASWRQASTAIAVSVMVVALVMGWGFPGWFRW